MSPSGLLMFYEVEIRRQAFPAQTPSFESLDDSRRFVRQALAAQIMALTSASHSSSSRLLRLERWAVRPAQSGSFFARRNRIE